VNPGAVGPVRLAHVPHPAGPSALSVPPGGYGDSGSWNGFWNQVGPSDAGPDGHPDDDLADRPGRADRPGHADLRGRADLRGSSTGRPENLPDLPESADLPGSAGLTEPLPMISPALPTAPPAVPAARPRPVPPPAPRPAPARRPVTPAAAPPWAAGPQTSPNERSFAASGAAPELAASPPPNERSFAPPELAATATPRRAATRHAPRRAARGRGKQPRWGWAYPIALTAAAASLAYLWRGPQYVRGGVLAVAVTLLLAAAARLVLPERRAGLLASRHRLADVAAFTILGLALLAAGLVLPAQS
jgi:hypothetical protein